MRSPFCHPSISSHSERERAKGHIAPNCAPRFLSLCEFTRVPSSIPLADLWLLRRAPQWNEIELCSAPGCATQRASPSSLHLSSSWKLGAEFQVFHEPSQCSRQGRLCLDKLGLRNERPETSCPVPGTVYNRWWSSSSVWCWENHHPHLEMAWQGYMNAEMPPWSESIPADWSRFPHSSCEYSSRLVDLNPGFIPGLPGKHFKSTDRCLGLNGKVLTPRPVSF